MIRKFLRRYREWLVTGLARKDDLDNLYNQIAGFTQIVARVGTSAYLKPLRGWALSPDAIGWIVADLQERDSPMVVEFGSGQSTIVFASILKRYGNGRLLSIEHDAAYAAELKRQLHACGLDEVVELRVLPLELRRATEQAAPCWSYPVEQLPDAPIDLVVIDGPPLKGGDYARFFPLSWALVHLREEGAIYLDDANRPSEQTILALARQQFPDVVCSELTSEKGLVLIQRHGESTGLKSSTTHA